MTNKQTVTERLDRLEAAVNGLAYFETRLAAIPFGVCPELDAIRTERHGSVTPAEMETRPDTTVLEGRAA
ncbi:MAG TPA: hypothetical protein VGH09_06585 [Solirubrobacteraceae bacterium]|jgi:hypothetical protein